MSGIERTTKHRTLIVSLICILIAVVLVFVFYSLLSNRNAQQKVRDYVMKLPKQTEKRKKRIHSEGIGKLGLSSDEHIERFYPGMEYSTIFYDDHILVYYPATDRSISIDSKSLNKYLCDATLTICDYYVVITNYDDIFIFDKKYRLIFTLEGDNYEPLLYRITAVVESADGELLLIGLHDDWGEKMSIYKLSKKKKEFVLDPLQEYEAPPNMSFLGNVVQTDSSLNPIVSCIKDYYICFGEMTGYTENEESDVDWINENTIIFTDKIIQSQNIRSQARNLYSDDSKSDPVDRTKRYPLGPFTCPEDFISISQWIFCGDDYCVTPAFLSHMSEYNYDSRICPSENEILILNKYRKSDGKYKYESKFELRPFIVTTEDLKKAAAFYADIN